MNSNQIVGRILETTAKQWFQSDARVADKNIQGQSNKRKNQNKNNDSA